MRFDGVVRGTWVRLAAALLIVLVTGPDIGPRSLRLTGERAANQTHDDGIAATSARDAAICLAIAPTGVPAPSVSTTERVAVDNHPPTWRVVTAGLARSSAAAKRAPTILRL